MRVRAKAHGKGESYEKQMGKKTVRVSGSGDGSKFMCMRNQRIGQY